MCAAGTCTLGPLGFYQCGVTGCDPSCLDQPAVPTWTPGAEIAKYGSVPNSRAAGQFVSVG